MLDTRASVRKYRQKWIDFLIAPERKQGQSYLARPDGRRCCLGHACHILKEDLNLSTFENDNLVYYDSSNIYPPPKVVSALGLYNKYGSSGGFHSATNVRHDLRNAIEIDKKEFQSLSDANDCITHIITPQLIGEYLQTVIEGGIDTPFKPLDYYEE